MNKEDRYFTIFSQAWYAKTVPQEYIDDVYFGIYPNGGNEGTLGEIRMVWRSVGGKIVPQIQAFDDSWRVLASFPDVLGKLAEKDGKNITVAEFAEILKSCGFKDRTQRKSPFDRS